MTGTPTQNAVHAIRRVAGNPKRHPATRQALLAIADMAAGITQPETLPDDAGQFVAVTETCQACTTTAPARKLAEHEKHLRTLWRDLADLMREHLGPDPMTRLGQAKARAWAAGWNARARGEFFDTNPHGVPKEGDDSTECAPRIGCRCDCHDPAFGMHVSHVAPCCDLTGVRSAPAGGGDRG